MNPALPKKTEYGFVEVRPQQGLKKGEGGLAKIKLMIKIKKRGRAG